MDDFIFVGGRLVKEVTLDLGPSLSTFSRGRIRADLSPERLRLTFPDDLADALEVLSILTGEAVWIPKENRVRRLNAFFRTIDRELSASIIETGIAVAGNGGISRKWRPSLSASHRPTDRRRKKTQAAPSYLETYFTHPKT